MSDGAERRGASLRRAVGVCALAPAARALQRWLSRRLRLAWAGWARLARGSWRPLRGGVAWLPLASELPYPGRRASCRLQAVSAAPKMCGARLGVPVARRGSFGLGAASDGAGRGIRTLRRAVDWCALALMARALLRWLSGRLRLGEPPPATWGPTRPADACAHAAAARRRRPAMPQQHRAADRGGACFGTALTAPAGAGRCEFPSCGLPSMRPRSALLWQLFTLAWLLCLLPRGAHGQQPAPAPPPPPLLSLASLQAQIAAARELLLPPTCTGPTAFLQRAAGAAGGGRWVCVQPVSRATAGDWCAADGTGGVACDRPPPALAAPPRCLPPSGTKLLYSSVAGWVCNCAAGFTGASCDIADATAVGGVCQPVPCAPPQGTGTFVYDNSTGITTASTSGVKAQQTSTQLEAFITTRAVQQLAAVCGQQCAAVCAASGMGGALVRRLQGVASCCGSRSEHGRRRAAAAEERSRRSLVGACVRLVGCLQRAGVDDEASPLRAATPSAVAACSCYTTNKRADEAGPRCGAAPAGVRASPAATRFVCMLTMRCSIGSTRPAPVRRWPAGALREETTARTPACNDTCAQHVHRIGHIAGADAEYQ